LEPSAEHQNTEAQISIKAVGLIILKVVSQYSSLLGFSRLTGYRVLSCCF